MPVPKYSHTPPPSPLAAALQHWHDDALEWCRGRHWPLRALLLLWLGYLGVRQFWDPSYSLENIFAAINLGIHEGGHLLARGLGRFLQVAAGSLLQCAVPVLALAGFFKQRDYFGIAVTWGWLSTNLVAVGVYMADARRMALPLVTVGGGSGRIEDVHDWHYLLASLGLLRWCDELGTLTRLLGHGVMLVCLVSGTWLLWKMATLPRR